MSDVQPLSEDDKQLLAQLDDDLETAENLADYEEIAQSLRNEFEDHLIEFRSFQRQVWSKFESIESQIEGQSQETDDAPPLIHYSNIPDGERSDILSTSDQIAVCLHENWADIAWKLGGASNYAETRAENKTGVDTKTKANAKYNPSKLRHRLKAQIGRDLRNNEIYRGLKRLSTLSGGEEVVNDADNRIHVIGGIYEYREMVTADKQDTKRVLWEGEE